MKKRILFPALLSLAAATWFTSCKSTATPVELSGEYGVEKVMDIPGTDEAFVLFVDSTSQLSANMGCNIINAGYKVLEQGKLEIVNPLSTKMMCHDTTLEDAFLAVLHKITEAKQEDGKLLLLDQEGNCLVTLIKR